MVNKGPLKEGLKITDLPKIGGRIKWHKQIETFAAPITRTTHYWATFRGFNLLEQNNASTQPHTPKRIRIK